MASLLTAVHLLAYLLLALSLAFPALRRLTMLALGAAAIAGVACGCSESGERSLTTIHTYAGFESNNLEVSMVRFPTGTVQAKCWQWPLPFAGFAMLWILLLAAMERRQLGNPLLFPLALAWTATATWLGMQMLAAPAEVVQPFGLDRFLWPAGLATALLAARSAKSMLLLFVWISAGTLGARLPAALFSKVASDLQLGGCLDVSSVRDIVNPMTQMQFEPRLEPGSGQQQFWLIWLEHVIFFPGVYVMSLLGIAFGLHMFHRQLAARTTR